MVATFFRKYGLLIMACAAVTGATCIGLFLRVEAKQAEVDRDVARIHQYWSNWGMQRVALGPTGFHEWLKHNPPPKPPGSPGL